MRYLQTRVTWSSKGNEKNDKTGGRSAGETMKNMEEV